LRADLAHDHSPESLVVRLAAAATVLMAAPARAPRRKRRGGMPRRVKRLATLMRALAVVTPAAPVPP
jgi:hypothetical protein